MLVIFVCLSVTFGIFVIAKAVVFVLPYSMTQFRIVVEILRVLLALALAYSWLRIWKTTTDWYFWRSVRHVTGQDEP